MQSPHCCQQDGLSPELPAVSTSGFSAAEGSRVAGTAGADASGFLGDRGASEGTGTTGSVGVGTGAMELFSDWRAAEVAGGGTTVGSSAGISCVGIIVSDVVSTVPLAPWLISDALRVLKVADANF